MFFSDSSEIAAILFPSGEIATLLMPFRITPVKIALVSRVKVSHTQRSGFAPSCPDTAMFPIISIEVISSVCSW